MRGPRRVGEDVPDGLERERGADSGRAVRRRGWRGGGGGRAAGVATERCQVPGGGSGGSGAGSGGGGGATGGSERIRHRVGGAQGDAGCPRRIRARTRVMIPINS